MDDYSTVHMPSSHLTEIDTRELSSNHLLCPYKITVFTAALSRGSSVTFTWMIDNNKKFSYKGPNYTVTFRTPGVYNLKVFAENPVSSQEVTLVRHVHAIDPPLHAELFLFSSLLLVNKTHEMSFKLQLERSSDLTISWDFGDGSPLLHRNFSPSFDLHHLQTVKEPLTNMNTTEMHTYAQPGNYEIKVMAYQDGSEITCSVKLQVVSSLTSLTLEVDHSSLGLHRVALLSALCMPSSFAVTFTWDFGDDSRVVESRDQQVKHIYNSVGSYKIMVTASNELSHVNETLMVTIEHQITGLQVRSNSPTELGTEITVFCSVTQGTNITWTFDMGDGKSYINQSGASVRHKYGQWAQVSKGSSFIFNWILMLVPLEIHNSSITIHPLELGDLLVEVWVENALGRVHAQTRLQVIERISGVAIQTPIESVAIGTPLNLTVYVQSGTNMQFTWDFGEDALFLSGQNRSMALSYLTQGLKVITVTVTNALSSVTVSSKLIIQESLLNISIIINGKYNNTAVPSHTIVLLCGSAHPGAHLFWEWRLTGFSENYMYSTQNVSHIFEKPGVYEVSLRAYNSISNAMISHILLVQDAITGFKVNTGRNRICAGQEVTFCPTIQYGTNVTFTFAFPKLNLSHLFSQPCSQFSFPFPGEYDVVSSAYNRVSLANYTIQIKVLDNSEGLKILGLSPSWPVMKTMQLLAEVESTYLHNFQWDFQQETQPVLTQSGQKVEFTPLELGTLHIVLNVSNHVCFSITRSLVIVQEPVTSVTLQISSEEAFLYQCLTFMVIVSDGSDLHFQWTFGEKNITAVGSSVEYCYHDVGEFMTNVTVFNLLSVVHASKKVTIRAEDCEQPLVWLVESPSVIYRADGGNFEAAVNLRDCHKYKIIYQWQVYRRSDNQAISLPTIDKSNALLTIPGHSLDTGMYWLRFTITLQGTLLTKDITHIFEVTHSLLVAQIHGGSKMIWPAETDLTLDGSKSYDPDQDDSIMKYEWSSEPNTEDRSCFLNFLPGLPTITIIWSKLCVNISYSFTLTILKPGRTPATARQTVFIRTGSVFPVFVQCLSCNLFPSTYISNRIPVILYGECDKCDNDTVFRWSAVDSYGNPLTLDKNTTTTSSSQRLVIQKGVLQDTQGYTFTLHVMQQMAPGWGEGSITLTPNHPPTGGQCSLLPQTTIKWRDTPLEYNCTGWKDPDTGSQLFYLLSVQTCSVTNCRKLFLYRGLKSSHSVWVPAAPKGGDIQIHMEVEDMQGGRTMALNCSLSVMVPFLYQEVSMAQWLRNHSESMLAHMQVVGDSTSLLQHALEIVSAMNLDNAVTSEEHKYHIHLRNSVTDALCSRNVSNLWEVAAFSAALTQCVVCVSVICDGRTVICCILQI
ncbi:polycystin-1-like [Dendrobates tinctorius]|uniref:polycystin-1-like n=1 Tax=Dendrobates tinctorius TaxID=92724 RepID=UPI003CCA086D